MNVGRNYNGGFATLCQDLKNLDEETNLGRYKIWLYAGTPAMNFQYLDGKNLKADADNQQERF